MCVWIIPKKYLERQNSLREMVQLLCLHVLMRAMDNKDLFAHAMCNEDIFVHAIHNKKIPIVSLIQVE